MAVLKLAMISLVMLYVDGVTYLFGMQVPTAEG